MPRGPSPRSPGHPALARLHITGVLTEGTLCCWLFHRLLLPVAEPFCRIQLGRHLPQEASLASSLGLPGRPAAPRVRDLLPPRPRGRFSVPPTGGSSTGPRVSQPHSGHVSDGHRASALPAASEESVSQEARPQGSVCASPCRSACPSAKHLTCPFGHRTVKARLRALGPQGP